MTCSPQVANNLIADFFLRFQNVSDIAGNNSCLQFQVKARATAWWQTKFSFFFNNSELGNLKSWLQGWSARTTETKVTERLALPEPGAAWRRIVQGFTRKHSLTFDQTGARDFVEPPTQNVTSFSWKLLDIPPGVLQSMEVIGWPLPKFGQPVVDLICSGMIQIPDYQSYLKDTKCERGMEPYDICAMMVSALADKCEPDM